MRDCQLFMRFDPRQTFIMCCNLLYFKSIAYFRMKLNGDALVAIILFEGNGWRMSSAENGSLGTSAYKILALT